MTSFANAVQNQEARTANGMKARATSGNACVDLFYQIGASRGKDIVPVFSAAYAENRDLALRIAQWARDVRGGAGERQLFRDILAYVENTDPDVASKLLAKVPELGRWDDLLAVKSLGLRSTAFAMIAKALFADKNGLCAKWMPRKGEDAVSLRSFLNLTPKAYRKLLVDLTKVVETQMYNKDWDSINFSHVPSVAAARYRNAFKRNTPKYQEYVEALKKGDNPEVKVNAGAVYPHDVIKSALKGSIYNTLTATDKDFINAQWETLPNYVGDANILPMVDVSGSMYCPAGSAKSVTSCIDVAVSLGLYCSEKNSGKFKDLVLTFSGNPELVKLQGDVVQRVEQLATTNWGMNTDIVRAFKKILSVATSAQVPQEEMPEILLILSDMQFDHCASFDDSAFESVRRQYESAGYKMPKVVFWNLNSYKSNAPVASGQQGTALVSGFSPSLLTSVLAADIESFSPEGIMLQTVMVPRYDL